MFIKHCDPSSGIKGSFIGKYSLSIPTEKTLATLHAQTHSFSKPENVEELVQQLKPVELHHYWNVHRFRVELVKFENFEHARDAVRYTAPFSVVLVGAHCLLVGAPSGNFYLMAGAMPPGSYSKVGLQSHIARGAGVVAEVGASPVRCWAGPPRPQKQQLKFWWIPFCRDTSPSFF